LDQNPQGAVVNQDDQADEVRQRMAALRRELEIDVQTVGQRARAMADWRFYVERFPFAAAAVAAAAGYMIVPRRPQMIVPDADTLAEMAKKNQVWLKTGSPKPVERERGMLGGLFALAATVATKAAVNWATQQFRSTLAARQQHAEQNEEPVTRTSPYHPR
jgi:hypothetical protein